MATTAFETDQANSTVEEAESLSLTSAAREKIQQLLTERNIPTYGLRVFVAGSGCSGLQYGMAFEVKAREFDTVIDQGDVQVFVDPTSMLYLAGASIDYVDGPMGAGFKIDNPNAVSTCGCGGADDEEGSSCGSGCSCH